MKKPQAKITIEFEADERESVHISAKETFIIAHDMYEALHESCPGCCMSILSALMSMLAIGYIKKGEKGGIIFPHEEWIKDITSSSVRAIGRYERIDNPTQ